jgi:protein O-mannosyl-transferase
MAPRKKNRARPSQPAKESAVSRWATREAAALTLILLITLLAYLPALKGEPLWDDDANMTSSELQSPSGLARIWFQPGATQQYYPLLHTAFWLEHRLWGDSPLCHHLVTLALHMISVVLVYRIVRQLEIPGALLAAAVFALHPVMVESVAWITEQKNTLSTVFYLSAMLTYLQFDSTRKRTPYFVALLLFALALFSKTAVVTFPAAILVVLWWQRGTISWRRDLLPLIPFFLLAAGAGLVTIYVERNFVGTEGREFEFTAVQRLLLAGRAVWFYIWKLFWPANLIFIYPQWNLDATVWWQWIFPIAALVATFLFWAIRKWSRAPLAAWLFFCGTLTPMIGFLSQYVFRYTFVADHFQYVASLGIIAPVAAVLVRGLTRVPQQFALARIGIPLMLLAALALLTRLQTPMYADPITLYQTTIERNPSCGMAYNNLGLVLKSKGNYSAAMEQFRTAIRLNPDAWMSYNNLGMVLQDTSNDAAAMELFRTAIRINPDSPSAHLNLGNALADRGQYDEAIRAFRAALAIDANNTVVLNSLGAAFIHLGQYGEARAQLEHALRLRPQYAEAHDNLGLALANSGEFEKALNEFRISSELNPAEANPQNNWGVFLVRSGRPNDAIVHYQLALQRRPDRVDIRSNLADALRVTRRMDQAITQYEIALSQKPEYFPARAGLAESLAIIGQRDKAIQMATQALGQARAANQTAIVQHLEDLLKMFHNSKASPAK